jgi:hypothetical protein
MSYYLSVDSITLTSEVLSKSLVLTILYLYVLTFLKSRVNRRLIKLFLFLYYLSLYTNKNCWFLTSKLILTVSFPIV